MFSLRDLPMPTIVEELDYETIVQRKLGRVKEILFKKGIDYQESEADDLMTLIEMDAYEEMLLRASINTRIKQLFLAYATGSNLDHIGTTRFGVERLMGRHPYAAVRFILSSARDVDTVIPAGCLLGDGENLAVLKDSVIVRAQETSAEGIMELQLYLQYSPIRCETILTPMPWVRKAVQIGSFSGGAEEEGDDRYRERLWLSRERKSTAGSEMMYRYYAKSADVSVKEVEVINGGAGVVKVYILGENFNTPEEMIDRVRGALNAEEVRPLTDSVIVYPANVIDKNIRATLYTKNPSRVDLDAIKARIDTYAGRFDVSLSIAKLYDLLIDDNVTDVHLDAPTSAPSTNDGEVFRFLFDLHVEVVL